MPIVPVTELYTTNVVQDGPDRTAVRSYIVDTTPDNALDATFTGGGIVPGTGETTIALPPPGEVHPQYPDLFVDRRQVRQRATNERTIVDVIYKRNTFGGVNPFRDDTDETLGAIRYNEPVSQITTISIPRILRRPVGGVDEFTTYNVQYEVPVSTMRVTTYIKSYDSTVSSQIRAYMGQIDTWWNDNNEINVDELAMFVGANVRNLGNKYQIVYAWRVKRFFKYQPSLLLTNATNSKIDLNGGGEVVEIANGDFAASAGQVSDPSLALGFYPFSQISLYRQAIQDLQVAFVEKEPVYIENPHRSYFTEQEIYSFLPGLSSTGSGGA